jgi:mannose-6-phosphate isomerase
VKAGLSTVEGDVSVVAKWRIERKSLMEINIPAEILGTEVYKRFGKQFLYF